MKRCLSRSQPVFAFRVYASAGLRVAESLLWYGSMRAGRATTNPTAAPGPPSKRTALIGKLVWSIG